MLVPSDWIDDPQQTIHMGRVSKSCNHAITQLHKILNNLRKFWNNECKTRKTNTNFIHLSQFLLI